LPGRPAESTANPIAAASDQNRGAIALSRRFSSAAPRLVGATSRRYRSST